jgi:hypothetical protein
MCNYVYLIATILLSYVGLGKVVAPYLLNTPPLPGLPVTLSHTGHQW